MWIVRQQDMRRSREGNTMASRRRVVSTMPKKYFTKVCGCLTFIYINLSAHFNKFIYPPKPKAQVHYCDHALSVVRPSLTFHIFDFSSETAEQNKTKLDRKQDINALYQVCVFRADSKNKMAALASDWLRHFRLLFRNCWTEDLNVLYKVCVLRADRKNKMAALASDWMWHFRLLLWNRWMEFNKTWQETRSQCPLPSLFFSGRSKKNKMAALTSHGLRHFQLLFWNGWTEFNETWQEANSQHPLPSLYYRKNKMAALADSSKRLHIVLRCTICGPFGILFILVMPPKGRGRDKRTRKNVVELEVQSPSRWIRKSPRTTPSNSSTCFGEPKSQPSSS